MKLDPSFLEQVLDRGDRRRARRRRVRQGRHSDRRAPRGAVDYRALQGCVRRRASGRGVWRSSLDRSGLASSCPIARRKRRGRRWRRTSKETRSRSTCSSTSRSSLPTSSARCCRRWSRRCPGERRPATGTSPMSSGIHEHHAPPGPLSAGTRSRSSVPCHRVLPGSGALGELRWRPVAQGVPR